MTPPKNFDPAVAAETIRNILAERAYAIYYEEKTSILQDLLAKLREKILYLLDKFLPDLDIPASVSAVLAYVVIAFFILLLAGCVIYIVNHLLRHQHLQRQAVISSRELRQSVVDHLNLAAECAAGEDLPAATRHLFLACILYLDQAGYVQARLWKTNGEYVEELRAGKPTLATVFDQLALKFEDGYYGGKLISREDYHRYRQRVLLLMQREGSDADSLV
ncbi:MAG: DUF4129 domain-containing protein [Peptococcaceae bacterium]|jgi:hypothetical protein|nr:DUF4129 domain-containing protein [Peptococcaceae bacterium]